MNQNTQITHEMALENFNHQLEYAISNYKSHGLNASQFSNIIIGGLGGSGIGGRIAKAYFSDKSSLPIEVYSDYQLPNYTSSKSLIILSSYSGLTEETLAMYEQAKSIGCTIICITSGGTLLQYAKENNLPVYPVEEGYQPRMALGFSLTYNLLIISDLLGLDVQAELKACSSIYANLNSAQTEAKAMLSFFENHLDNKFVIVSDNQTEAIGVRFCQQIQENAKVEAFINVLPEANHNAFETYYGKLPSNFIFINSNTNERNNGRFAYLKQLLEKQGNIVYEQPLKDASIGELYRNIYTCDWFSIYLSNKKGADNMSVPNISGLKNFLLTYK
ncbi:MAG: SIS domain-containing protein [Bacteroidia bacterium]